MLNQQFRKSGLEPIEARERLIDLLCQWPSMPCKKRYLTSGREEILPVVDGQIEGIGLSVEIDPITTADYLEIHYAAEYRHPSLPDDPAEFLVPTANVARELERLYPTAAPSPPAKEPASAPVSPDEIISIIAADQPEERQRAARKSELVEKAIAGRFPTGIPETLPNPELIQAIMRWLADYCRENEMPLTEISDSQILRVSGRKR
jgi:hypothetical protein